MKCVTLATPPSTGKNSALNFKMALKESNLNRPRKCNLHYDVQGDIILSTHYAIRNIIPRPSVSF